MTREPQGRTMFRGSAGAAGSALLLAAVLSTPSRAEPASLGPMRYEAPSPVAGWRSQPAQSGVIYRKEVSAAENEGRKGGAIVQILGPFQDGPATFDSNFEASAGLIKGMAEEDPISKSDGRTTNGHRIRSDLRCCGAVGSVSVSQRTVGIASQTRQVFLVFADLQLDDEAQEKAEAEFAALVRSIRLESSDEGFALAPRSGDGGLDGVYTHLSTGVVPNAFGGVDFRSDSEITVFDPSGLFATELPEGGDIRAHCAATPTDCGLYALAGGGLLGGARTIEMRRVADAFGTLESETSPIETKDGGLVIDGSDYAAVPPPPAGTPFEGTWRYFFASSGTTALSSGGVSSEQILTLGRDGRFRRSGFAGGTATNSAGGGTTGVTVGSDRPATSGRYRVEGYALVLEGESGGTERLSLFMPETGDDALLVIDGSNFLRQDEAEGAPTGRKPQRR